jgi:4-hydroxy-tetrahydrodipicolinate synthase
MRWAAEGLPPERLMVGTGTPALEETLALTAYADDLGYGVALVLPPYYYTPVSDAGLYEWYRALHLGLGERTIRIYFYNYPQMTGIPIPVSVATRLNADFPERFAGIKDSSADLPYCRELVRRIPGFRVFPSSETALGEAAASGFAGCISATVNVSAPLCGRIWAEREAVPEALLDRAGAIRAAVAAHPLIPAVKEMVARRTGDAGWRRVLPPFLALSDGARDELAQLQVD